MRPCRLLAGLVIGLATALPACEGAPQAQTAPATIQSNGVVARVADRVITLEEVDEEALQADTSTFRGMRLEQALYEARSRTLSTLVADLLIELEADERGVSPQELMASEVLGDVPPVTDAEIESWFEANAARIGSPPLDEVRDAILRALTEDRQQTALYDYVTALRSKWDVSVSLEPPRTEVEVAASDPSKGPADAPIVIVEFSDFQCPFCRQVVPTLQEIEAEYPGKIRRVFKDFPLASHPEAFKASEAARCAGDQGRYWDFYTTLFENQRNGLEVDDLVRYAGEQNLDVEAFSTCLDASTHAASVQSAFDEGQSYGVAATPTFFINGRELAGAQPFETFRRVIDEELARLDAR